MRRKRLLSIVIPVGRQERTIVKDIKSIDETLSQLNCRHEIIVVADGFLDRIYEILNKQKRTNKNLKVLGYEENHGKGYAVKYGMLKAKGDIVGFIDAGMDIDPSEISIALDLMDWNNADIVIGSKLHPESKVNYPLVRKVLSWGYRTLAHTLFGFKVRDTQVGLKLFKRQVAYDIFSRILVKSFAFDVEVLAVAYAFGYHRIYESPIKLNFKNASTITSLNFWRIIFWMLWDTAAVFYRLKILHYYDRIEK